MTKNIRYRLHEIIFEADTFAGKLFDLVLLGLILLSVLVVMLESMAGIMAGYGSIIYWLEWLLTIIFTVEYLARIYVVEKPIKYILSFYGLVDLLSVLPTYIGLFTGFGHSSLVTIRALRLLRIFRILKLGRYLKEANHLKLALQSSRRKIVVFLFVIFSIVIIMGTVMYLIEGSENGFTSIPRSIYWAIVTLTTVGYGDIAPQTGFGQFIASIIMITGYAIIAVPTGIVTSELAKTSDDLNTQHCSNCNAESHSAKAKYCHNCGNLLNPTLR